MGALMGLMFEPLLLWTNRMKIAGTTVHSFDFFFSLCIGIFITSTLYLVGGGVWKRLQGLPLEKCVLRPALFSGVVWAVACLAQLYAVLALPYSIAYCCCSGGSLVVSLTWGMLKFGEASSTHNRKCVAISFIGVAIGIILLGLSK